MGNENMLMRIVDELSDSGYKRTYVRDQIAGQVGVTSRVVNMWMRGTCVPDVYKAQRVAEWCTKKLGRKVRVDDIWPIPRTA